MDHADHVALLRPGVAGVGCWADLGAGSGAFTVALAELLGPGGEIVAIDRDAAALRELGRAMAARFPVAAARTLVADYLRDDLALPPLDGVVMANALHFQRPAEQRQVLARVRGWLRPGGRLLVVEYDTDRGNRWVPYPLSFASWQRLADECGFHATRRIGQRPSRFLGAIYSALSFAPDGGEQD